MKSSFFKYWLWFFVIITNSCHHSEKKTNTFAGEKSGLKPIYAERFLIEKHKNYTKLVIKNPWQGARDITQEYYLIRKGWPVPDGIEMKNVIYIPVEKIVCLSTTHIAMISSLHSESSIVAVSGADYIYNDEIKRATDSGKIKDIGYEDNLNKEMILELSPDLVMVYGIGSESAGYLGKLSELGIKVVFNADYLETDPLGKAEWIKVIGSLYGKENEADSIFDNISEEYNFLKSFIISKTNSRPSVLLGLPWKDTWYVSPGNSYISKLINDAGGRYLWNETKSEVSMPYGLENVFLKALEADYWLNIGSTNSKNEIIAIDDRMGELAAFKNGRLFNNNNRISKTGGNDYWESGSINPQMILRDMAVILHPELFSDHDLYYYKKIE
jgi:iron complex transport system substrate-binding protein